MENTIPQKMVRWSSTKQYKYKYKDYEASKKVYNITLDILTISEITEHDLTAKASVIMTYANDIKFPPVFKNAINTVTRQLHASNGMQKIHYDMELYIHNQIQFIPFNRQYFFLDILMLDKSDEYEFKFSVNLDYSLYDRFLKYKVLVTDDGFIYEWKCNKYQSYKESVLKYMVIPYSLTILQQLTHSIKKSGKGDLIAVSSTFMLGDIALFFTLPQTSRLTGLEKSLLINLFFKFYVAIVAFYDFDNKISSTDSRLHFFIDVINSLIISFFIIGYYIWIALTSLFGKFNSNHGKIILRSQIIRKES